MLRCPCGAPPTSAAFYCYNSTIPLLKRDNIISYDPILGQSLTGAQLQLIPPNASEDQKITLINQAIETLNNYSRDLVLSGSVLSLVDGTDPQVIKVEHNLSYAPRAYCYLNGQTIEDALGNVFPDVNIPLPTSLEFSESGGTIIPKINIDYFTDATYLYIRIINSTGQTSTNEFTVSYELTRTAAT